MRGRFSRYAHIIDVQGADKIIVALDNLAHLHVIDFIYVVGGDGTFNNVLNWIASRLPEIRPALVSVGGGQFCYMTHFHGLPSKDPIKNLGLIFEKRIKLVWKKWQPVCVHDSITQSKRYAAVVGGGVIADILQWYESVGKGGFFKVLRIVLIAILSVAFDTIRRLHGRLNMVEGELTLGTSICAKKTYTGFALSTIPELLASCRPFAGLLNQHEFYAAAYWGTLRRLAFASPFVWFGHMPFWIRGESYNQPIRKAVVKTADPRLVLDGDVFVWPQNDKKAGEKRTLTFTIGETITLLVVDRA